MPVLRADLDQLFGLPARHSPAGPQLPLVFGELLFDLVLSDAALDDVLSVPLEEVVDRLDANPDGARRLVLIQILEAEVRRAGPFDDAFDDAVDGRVVAALEARHFERHQVRMPRGELRGPDLVIGA